MKDNYTSSTKLIVDTISIDRLLMCKLDTCSTLKKTEKNKTRKCIRTLSHFLAEVIYIPGFKI